MVGRHLAYEPLEASVLTIAGFLNVGVIERTRDMWEYVGPVTGDYVGKRSHLEKYPTLIQLPQLILRVAQSVEFVHQKLTNLQGYRSLAYPDLVHAEFLPD